MESEFVTNCTAVQTAFFQFLDGNGSANLYPIGHIVTNNSHINMNSCMAKRQFRLVVLTLLGYLKYMNNKEASIYPTPLSRKVKAGRPFPSHCFTIHTIGLTTGLQGLSANGIESISDIILTGHEHDTTKRSSQGTAGERNEYIEGGALQSEDMQCSAFNVIGNHTVQKKQNLPILNGMDCVSPQLPVTRFRTPL